MLRSEQYANVVFKPTIIHTALQPSSFMLVPDLWIPQSYVSFAFQAVILCLN